MVIRVHVYVYSLGDIRVHVHVYSLGAGAGAGADNPLGFFFSYTQILCPFAYSQQVPPNLITFTNFLN